MREVRGVYTRLLADGAMDEGGGGGGGGSSGGGGGGVDVADTVEGGCRARRRAGSQGKRKRAGAAGAAGAVAGTSGVSGSAGAKARLPRGPKHSMIDRCLLLTSLISYLLLTCCFVC